MKKFALQPKSISTRFLLVLLALSLVPFVVANFAAYTESKNNLKEQIENQLEDASELAQYFVQDWYNARIKEAERLAADRLNRELLVELRRAHRASELDVDRFINSQRWKDVVVDLNPELEKHLIYFEHIYDILIMDERGNVLYTVVRESDLGTNMVNGPFAQSHLGKTFRAVVDQRVSLFSDLAPYKPSQDVIAGFIVTPIYDRDDNFIGVVAMQFEPQHVVDLLHRKKDSALNHYLVGVDGLARTDGHIGEVNALKTQTASSHIKPWKEWIKKESGDYAAKIASYQDRDRQQLLGILRPIKVAQVNWALITESYERESFAGLTTLRQKYFIVGVLLALGLGAASVVFARRVTSPLLHLTNEVKRSSQLEKFEPIEIHTKDEVQQLAEEFNRTMERFRENEQKLSTSLGQMELVLETTGIGVWDWNLKTGEANINELWAKIIGYKPEELYPTTIDTLVERSHPGDMVKTTEDLKRHWRGEDKIYVSKYRVQHRLGHWVWVEDTGRVVEWDKDGKPYRMLGTHLDISERVRNQEELQKLSRIASQSINAVIITDKKGKVEWVNDGFTRMSGYTIEDVAHKKPGDVLQGPGSDPEIKQIMSDAIKSEESFHVEVINFSKDRKAYWVDILCNPLKDDNGKLEGFMAIQTDITAQKKAALELERQQSLLQEMSELGTIGAWEYDVIKNQLYWSEMTKRIHEVPVGFEPKVDDALGFYDEGYSRNKISEVFSKCIESGTKFNVELPMTSYKGNKFWAAAAGRAHYEFGKVTRVYGSFQNITERKTSEAALVESKEAAEAGARIKSEFLASMSHEIRTPMNGVLGMLNLLSHTSLDDAQSRQVQVASSSAHSLLDIINDILDFSKVEAGKLDLEELDFDLLSHLSDFANSVALRAFEKGIELILDTRNVNAHFVKGDPGRLRQILTNLVSNAIKFTDSGEIVITCGSEIEGSSVILTISVRDSGIGIPSDKVDGLFDSFTQVDASTTRKYGGTGLGLAIVKQLCGLMNGSVSAASEPGEGSTFTFNVTLKQSEEKASALPVSSFIGLPVLVVDNNETSREVIRAQLFAWGADVHLAESAATGLKLVEKAFVDRTKTPVVILDACLSGEQIDKVSRDFQHWNSEAKLILMTSIAERGDAKRFADLGFSAYFSKPIASEDMRNAISIVMDNGEALKNAHPLVTHHYVKSLSSQIEEGFDWPENTRVLLVEDNAINQEVAVGILQEFELTADAVANGIEAIESLNFSIDASPYTIVIMDCQMPELDGYEATRRIRSGEAGEQVKNIPIIAMTANAMVGDREKCLRAGMDDYITKPVEPSALLKQLRFWLMESDEMRSARRDENRRILESSLMSEASPKSETGQDNETSVNNNIPHEGDTKNTGGTDSSSRHSTNNSNSDTSMLKDWDREAALKRVRGKPERLTRLVGLFLADIPDRIKECHASYENHALEELRENAHAIKGVVGNLGADKLFAAAADLELSIKSGDFEQLEKDAQKAKLQALDDRYGLLHVMLQAYLDAQSLET